MRSVFTRRTFLAGSAILGAQVAGPALPGTQPLTMAGDLKDQMMIGAHAFVERKISLHDGKPTPGI